jgi:hypothetical protein
MVKRKWSRESENRTLVPLALSELLSFWFPCSFVGVLCSFPRDLIFFRSLLLEDSASASPEKQPSAKKQRISSPAQPVESQAQRNIDQTMVAGLFDEMATLRTRLRERESEASSLREELHAVKRVLEPIRISDPTSNNMYAVLPYNGSSAVPGLNLSVSRQQGSALNILVKLSRDAITKDDLLKIPDHGTDVRSFPVYLLFFPF